MQQSANDDTSRYTRNNAALTELAHRYRLLLLTAPKKSSSLAAAPAPAPTAAPSHVASCFVDNGWRNLIGIVKDSKDNIL